MTITVSFPGGVAVDATVGIHTIHTDQPEPLGSDTAMSPFDVFLSSIAACMGFYALRFCQQRDIPTDRLSLQLEPVRDADGKHVDTIKVVLRLPASFPEKYQDAIHRAVDQCSVKRHLKDPPAFELTLQESEAG